MPAARNINELTKHLDTPLKNAMIVAQSKVYQCINSFIKEYYDEYNPDVYERTYSFYNSLVKSDIKKTKNGYACEVYIDMDRTDYYAHSFKDVVNMINRGFHADTGMNNGDSYQTPVDIRGIRVWNESMDEIQKTNLILNTFKDYFKSNGFIVREL